jgi:hypothetical protein
MKKQLIITLIDDTTIVKDLSDKKGLPFNAGALHPFYIGMARDIAATGWFDDEHANESCVEILAASQIKKVKVIIDKSPSLIIEKP